MYQKINFILKGECIMGVSQQQHAPKDQTNSFVIEFQDPTMTKSECEEIHQLLFGSQNYVNSDILLNVDEGLYLNFDFSNSADIGDMFHRLKTLVSHQESKSAHN